MANPINTKASTLPAPPTDYSQLWAITLLNTLRLYFNTIDNFTQQITDQSVGRTRPTTYALLPSASISGMGSFAFISDSTVNTFGTVVAGGGSYAVPVYSDGTNWRVG